LPSGVYAVLGLTRLAAAGPQDVSRATLRPLLALQLVLLEFSGSQRRGRPLRDPTHSSRFGRYARRCRDGRADALVQISLVGHGDRVMTTDITKFMMISARYCFGSDPDEVARAASRAKAPGPHPRFHSRL